VDNRGFATAHGKLTLGGKNGVQLVDAKGEAVQLMGLSSHGLSWFPKCYTKAALTHIASTWGVNVFRAAMYVKNFAANPAIEKTVFDIVEWTRELGIYVIIDWHVLTTPGDPTYGWIGQGCPKPRRAPLGCQSVGWRVAHLFWTGHEGPEKRGTTLWGWRRCITNASSS
jgi:hypothetical protein